MAQIRYSDQMYAKIEKELIASEEYDWKSAQWIIGQ